MKILEKIGKVIEKSLYFLCGYTIFCPLGNFLSNELSDRYGQKIKDRAHLEILVNQEKEKLGFKNKNIEVYFIPFINTSIATKLNKNDYRIFLSSKQRTIETLRHEFYHIFDGHCDEGYELYKNGKTFGKKLKNDIKYNYIYEPQAVVYSLTGIKL